MTCSDFYNRICSQRFAQCDTFRYYDKNSGGDLELGFINDEKIHGQSIIELKGAIRGWMNSRKFVGAKRIDGYAVLFESNEINDPNGIDYAEPGKHGVANLQGFVI